MSFEAKRVSAPTPKEEEDPEPLLADMFDNIFSRRASFKVKAEIAERELYQKQLKMLSEREYCLVFQLYAKKVIFRK